MKSESTHFKLYSEIADLLRSAKSRVLRSVNHTMVITYFEVGKLIVEEEQNGNQRAGYGKHLLQGLSEALTNEFGKGFSVTNIQQMRSFYLVYQKQQTLSDKLNKNQPTLSVEFNLSWSHYLRLMRIEDDRERKFYEIESIKNNWSVRELKRQFDSALYTRLVLSQEKEKVLELSKKGHVIEKPKDLVKDPYILEFLELTEPANISESQLEEEIISKLEHFLLELGNGFTFVARQKRISFDEKHFYIDLVFYNRILKCFVLIDLKIGELRHQDLGQMQMYVNYFDREMRLENEEKTIGLVLCRDKNDSIIKYTLPEENDQIFARNIKRYYLANLNCKK